MKQHIKKIIVFTIMTMMISFISCQKESDFERLETNEMAEIKSDIEEYFITPTQKQKITVFFRLLI